MRRRNDAGMLSASFLMVSGLFVSAQADEPFVCESAVSQRIQALQQNSQQLAVCVAKPPTQGSGAFCDARMRTAIKTPSLFGSCAALEEQRCASLRELDKALQACGVQWQQDSTNAKAVEVFGAAQVFARRMARFDEARRLASVPKDFSEKLGRPYATEAGHAELGVLAEKLANMGCDNCGVSTADVDKAVAALSDASLLGPVYGETHASLTSFAMSLQAFTLDLGRANAKEAAPPPEMAITNGSTPTKTSSDADAIKALVAAAGRKADQAWNESSEAASQKIPSPDSMRMKGGMGSFVLGQVNSLVSSVREADAQTGDSLLGASGKTLDRVAAAGAATKLFSAKTEEEKRAALDQLNRVVDGASGSTHGGEMSLLTVGAVWFDQATGGTSGMDLSGEYDRTIGDILERSVRDMPSSRNGPAGRGVMGGTDTGVKVPTPPSSARDASGCPNDMEWLSQHMRTPEMKAPGVRLSIDQYIEAGGGLDRALLLTRAQCREYDESYEVNKANTELRDSLPGHYRDAMILFEDGIKHCQAYLQALECRRRAESAKPAP